MIEFKSLDEIEDHIKDLAFKTDEGQIFEEKVIDIFSSDLINDPESFAHVQSCFYVETGKFLPHIVLNNLEKLKDVDLSFFKFCILCGLRGPLEPKDLDSQVRKNKGSAYVALIAKHKDFPAHLKQMFFEMTGEVEYLPEEAQDMFIF